MSSLISALALSGAVRGPYTKPLLPALGRTIREESWPLPIAIMSLKLRELAVIERRAQEQRRTTWRDRISRRILREG
jgi:hypothetical protein